MPDRSRRACRHVARTRRSLPTAPGQYRLLVSSLATGVVFQDASGKIIEANTAAQRILGLDSKHLIGRTSDEPAWRAIWEDGSPAPGEDHPAMVALRTGRPSGPTVLGIAQPNGQTRWLLVTATPRFHAGDNRPFQVVATFDDITELRAASEALRVSEMRARQLVESNVVGVAEAELHGVVAANDAFLNIIGYTRADLDAGRIDWRAITPPEFHQFDNQALTELHATGTCTPFEKEYIRRNGTRVAVLLGATVVERDPFRWISFVLDLTEQRRANARIRQQASMLGQAYDAIFAWDWDGAITFWNRGAERMYGFSEEQAIGRVSHGLLHTNYLVPAAEVRARLEQNGMWEGEVEQTHRTGRKMTVESRQVLVDESGHRYVLEVDRDVSLRKQIESERREFVDALAHDLKNPLGVVKAQAQLVQRRLRRTGQVDSVTVEHGIEQIVTAADRMNALISEMVEVAHVREGLPFDLRLEPVDLVALARAAHDDVARLGTNHRVSFESSLPALVGDWDRSRIQRAIANLLDNAVKYSPAGGAIHLAVERGQDGAGEWAEVRVTDEGLGIPPDELPYVFERFRRARNVAGVIPGAGIGLAGSLQSVEQHGGTITVRSVEGDGATFTIRLPLAPL